MFVDNSPTFTWSFNDFNKPISTYTIYLRLMFLKINKQVRFENENYICSPILTTFLTSWALDLKRRI